MNVNEAGGVNDPPAVNGLDEASRAGGPEPTFGVCGSAATGAAPFADDSALTGSGQTAGYGEAFGDGPNLPETFGTWAEARTSTSGATLAGARSEAQNAVVLPLLDGFKGAERRASIVPAAAHKPQCRTFSDEPLADRVQLLCVGYVALWTLSPPLMIGEMYRWMALGATLLWVVIEAAVRPDTFFRPSRPVALVSAYIAYSALVGWMLGGSDALLRDLQMFISFLFLYFYESHVRRNIRQLRPVFWMALVALPVWLAISINTYLSNPHASRILVRSSGQAEELWAQGVGGYALVYTVVIAVPVLLHMLLRRAVTSKLLYMVLAANVLLSTALVLRAGYSIAVVLLVASVIVTLFSEQRRHLNVPLTLLGIVFAAFLAWRAYPIVSAWVLEQSSGTSYERKVEDVITSLGDSESEGTLAFRTDRYLRSALLCVYNPVTGVLRFDDLGKHSELLDTFGRYGVPVGLLFAYCVFYLPLRDVRRGRKSQHNVWALALTVLVVSVLFTLFNNVFAAFGFMVFVFYPVAASYLDDRERRDQKHPQLAPIHEDPHISADYAEAMIREQPQILANYLGHDPQMPAPFGEPPQITQISADSASKTSRKRGRRNSAQVPAESAASQDLPVFLSADSGRCKRVDF
jgi:hypothetical protein